MAYILKDQLILNQIQGIFVLVGSCILSSKMLSTVDQRK